MKRTHRPQQEGFALVIVVMIVAAISLVAVTLLNFVNLDIIIAAQNRKTQEARNVAECGVTEVIDHSLIGDYLPDFADQPNLASVYSDPDNMLGGVTDPLGGVQYCVNAAGTVDRPASKVTSQARFLRYVPLTESSINWSRALVFEVRTIGDVANGESTSEVMNEVWRVASYAPGTLLPRMHAR